MRISDWSLDVCSSDLKANSNQPSGTLYGAQRSYTVQANGQLRDAAAYTDAVIAYRNGAPVRLRDAGRAVDSIENDKQATEFNGRPSIAVSVSRQPGPNPVSISHAVRTLLPAIEQQAPWETHGDRKVKRREL